MPDFFNDKVTGAEFEASVRHVARQLYRNANTSGAIILDDRERDDVIDTGTELIVVEATQSRKLDKAEQDLKKSVELIRSLKNDSRFSDYNFRILLVTSDDPTADQNGYVRAYKAGCPKEIISFTQLFSRLFDARHYVRLRGDHFFGSVRDPANENNFRVPQSDYIATALSKEGSGQSLKASDIVERLESGIRVIIYGDYGSGKSMTMRDMYYRARDSFILGRQVRCPVYINLREHIAQTQPDEALYRHAEKIGFQNSHSLIAAWRAGFVSLFLDGFDELTPPQFASSVSNLRQARKFAVEIVSRFIEQTAHDAPIVIAGRESYFDDRNEARLALGYSESDEVYDLAGFTNQDIEKFLKTKGAQLPSWLPTRPLLLGYLANAGVLKAGDDLLSLDPANGWDRMLQQVCEREVRQIWGVGFEASDLRRFIEGLATQARKSRDGRGLEDSGLSSVFRSVFGRDADEPANLLTLRLPGLGAVPGRAGAREFIDSDFADAAASGDLTRFVDAPFAQSSPLSDIALSMGEIGRQMTILRSAGSIKKVSVALAQAAQTSSLAITASDLMMLLIDLDAEYEGPPLRIENADFDRIIAEPQLKLRDVVFVKCIIHTLEFGQNLGSDAVNTLPKFLDCVIDSVEGALSIQDIPKGIIIGNTSVESFAAFSGTNGAVIQTNLPPQVKVLLTVLRKLFMQRGAGRQYSALRRGLPVELLKYVDPVVSIVKSKGFAEDVYINRRQIIVPSRVKSGEALAIINGPNASTHSLLSSVKSLG